ncbi:MAG: peptide ABC transporter permease [Litorilinea sp.]|nr:MAG: peptide ABC transporter permease [Litorilinea sp.]
MTVERAQDVDQTLVPPVEESGEILLPGFKEEGEEIYVASQWRLMWWRFRKHRMAVLSLVVLGLLYFGAAFCEFVATNDPREVYQNLTYAPPRKIHFVDENGFSWRPFVYGYKATRDMETFKLVYEEDRERKYYLHFFVEGDDYKLFGLFPGNIHLFGLKDADEPLYLLGGDRLGRDLFSRIIYGSRISLTVGLVGVFLSMILGTLIGGISGYYGGTIDVIVQRVIELLISIPSIPLWMGFSAALPADWSPVKTYFGITIILSIIGWSGLARVVRGKFIALREEEFVVAARLINASEMRIIVRHLVPSFASHLIASLTLSIPGMILGETSLSFLGLGLQPPVISWGVLLQEAQNFQTVANAAWLLLPGFFVVIAVLAFNFVGDGLRDAADPYA